MAVYLSLGGNMGDRKARLAEAVEALDGLPDTTVRTVSRCYETEPLGLTDQPAFLNLAVEIETSLKPLELLEAAKAIERRLGRARGRPWGPRPIDIDIILYGSLAMDRPELTLPHKEFRRRAFVLTPLAEIAPGATDPVSGKTVAELAGAPEAEGAVRELGRLLR